MQRRRWDRARALSGPGDWNAFFGFGTNILVDVLVLTGLAPLRSQDAAIRWCSAIFPPWG